MMAYCASQISPHLAIAKDGALICRSVPIARTGIQKYRASELGISNSDDLVSVRRLDSEVFDPAALASFEAVPLTDNHPGQFVTPENWSGISRGHVQNVREGPRLPTGERQVVADLIVHDADLIEKIRNGKRSVSCGYDTQYAVLRDGTFAQTKIRGNHVAVVTMGRAGTTKIMDGGVMKNTEVTRLLEEIEVMIGRLAKPRYAGSHASVNDVDLALIAELRETKRDMDLWTGSSADAAAFASSCNSLGAKQRGVRDCRSSLVSRPAAAGATDAEDWADTYNRAGRAMREG